MSKPAKHTSFSKQLSLWGLLKVTVVTTCLLSVISIFSHVHHYIELASHFKAQYLVWSIICLIPFAIKRRYGWASALVGALVINTYYVLPWYLPEPLNLSEPQASQPLNNTLKIIHSNVKMSNTQSQKLIKLVQSESPDVLVVQEVNAWWINELSPLKSDYPYQQIVAREDNFGIAVYSKYPINNAKKTLWGDRYLPSLQMTLQTNEQAIELITTHPLPPISASYFRSRNSQLKDVTQAIQTFSMNEKEKPIIVIGDFNITMWSSYYTPLESTTGLRNARKGFGIIPTWPVSLPFLVIPIDHCLVSKEISVTDISAGPNVGSDHLPLIVELKW